MGIKHLAPISIGLILFACNAKGDAESNVVAIDSTSVPMDSTIESVHEIVEPESTIGPDGFYHTYDALPASIKSKIEKQKDYTNSETADGWDVKVRLEAYGNGISHGSYQEEDTYYDREHRLVVSAQKDSMESARTMSFTRELVELCANETYDMFDVHTPSVIFSPDTVYVLFGVYMPDTDVGESFTVKIWKGGYSCIANPIWAGSEDGD